MVMEACIVGIDGTGYFRLVFLVFRIPYRTTF